MQTASNIRVKYEQSKCTTKLRKQSRQRKEYTERELGITFEAFFLR